jgi:hypothetical protein
MYCNSVPLPTHCFAEHAQRKLDSNCDPLGSSYRRVLAVPLMVPEQDQISRHLQDCLQQFRRLYPSRRNELRFTRFTASGPHPGRRFALLWNQRGHGCGIAKKRQIKSDRVGRCIFNCKALRCGSVTNSSRSQCQSTLHISRIIVNNLDKKLTPAEHSSAEGAVDQRQLQSPVTGVVLSG